MPAERPPSSEAILGTQIGPYKVLEVLGEGGMGTVYLAEQRSPVQRRVALKVIKLGMDTKETLARFELERQALAVMDHPHVAKVFDAGATERGQPYFAMELVKGEPIDAFCEKRKLPLRERIELFRQVCFAVQHAHHKGIVHRDLKPTNILITLSEDRPFVKIIDFGVARATDHRLTARTLFTERGQLLGTPEYMSPEQADAGAIDIDTRTDVYSLGVVLYQLLVGALPFDPRDMRKEGYSEMQRKIREETPPKPSTRASTLVHEARAARVFGQRALAGELKGDLDWITMKALEKDRARRYQTPSELAADLLRYLEHEPVLAGPPSALYRISKFVHRRKGAVAAVAAVIVSLTAGLIVSLRLYAAAERERDRARIEAAKAEQTAAFAQDMLAGVDPVTARGMDTKLLRTILDQSSARVQSELGAQPEVEAAIRETIGKTYTSIGAYAQAEPHLVAAEGIRKRTLGDNARATLHAERELAWLRLQQGRYADAEALARQTLRQQLAAFGPDDKDTLTTMGSLGSILNRQGKNKEAEGLLREAIERRRNAFGPDDRGVVDATMTLAIVETYLENFADAEALHRQALDAKVRLLGADHPSTFLSKGNLALVLEDEDKMAEATALHREVLEGMRRLYGPEHPQTLREMNNLATLYYRSKHLEEAEKLHRETLALRTRVLGPDDPMTLFSLNNLGDTLRVEDKLDEADLVLQKALDARRRVLGDHVDTIASLDSLGFLRRAQGRNADAAKMFGEKVEILRRLFGNDDPRIELPLYNHAAMLQDAGDDKAAEPVFREVLQRHGKVEEKPSPWIPAAMNGLAKCLFRSDDLAGAETQFRQALAIRRHIYSGPQSDVADSLEGLGEVLLAEHRAKEAEPLLREALDVRKATAQRSPLKIAEAQGLLGACLAACRDYAAAEPLLLASQVAFEKAPSEGVLRRRALARLVDLYGAWPKAEEASAWKVRLEAAGK